MKELIETGITNENGEFNIKENLMDNVMNIIELNGENIDKYIQYDK